jgi:glutamyl-tRNA synthetase
VLALLKDRAHTLEELAESVMIFYREPSPQPGELSKALTEPVARAVADLRDGLHAVGEWHVDTINPVVQQVLKKHSMKMPALAMPVRLLVFGVTQTPALSPVLAVAGRERVLERLGRA